MTDSKPIPCPTPETKPYWDACRSGELRLQRCGTCRSLQFPPRRFCSSCLAEELAWEAACGRGRIVSFTIVRHPPSPAFADDVPYIVALIELEEGPMMMAGIRRCDPDAVSIGLAVEVEFEQRSAEIHVPYFHPV